jgi:hypothetical protein
MVLNLKGFVGDCLVIFEYAVIYVRLLRYFRGVCSSVIALLSLTEGTSSYWWTKFWQQTT